MDYCIITSCNRKIQVESLVKSIQQVFKGKIIVFDDGSEQVPEVSCELIHYKERYGKRRYYQLVTDIFQLLKRNSVQRFWMLPDDVIISPDLFETSKLLWNAIKDERKICLSVGHTDNRHLHPCWTQYQPIKMGEVVLTNWNDLAFMAERQFLEQLNYEIEKPYSDYDFRSSGVGRYISRTLYNRQWNMYHVNKSLLYFPPIETQMHRELVK